jgi:hypothetical protein
MFKAVSEKAARNALDHAAISQNRAAPSRCVLADAVMACKLTPKQYNFQSVQS